MNEPCARCAHAKNERLDSGCHGWVFGPAPLTGHLCLCADHRTQLQVEAWERVMELSCWGERGLEAAIYRLAELYP